MASRTISRRPTIHQIQPIPIIPPITPPSICIIIAKLDNYSGRKSYLPPGWTALLCIWANASYSFDSSR